ncbi:hypothetical protein Tco_0386695 [Tanacetum coccineum]
MGAKPFYYSSSPTIHHSVKNSRSSFNVEYKLRFAAVRGEQGQIEIKSYGKQQECGMCTLNSLIKKAQAVTSRNDSLQSEDATI